MNFNKKIVSIFLIFLTLAICISTLCFNIDSYCIVQADEGRNVASAIEMLKNGKWFTIYYEGKPDTLELNPPFLVWCQLFSFKLFGLSELSARVPSMIFSISTVLFLFWFSYKITGDFKVGIVSILILVSSLGYIGKHSARFGDHDVILTFFSTAFICYSYLYLKTFRTNYLILLFISLFLGWLSKSVVVFMFIPPLLVWLLLNKKISEVIYKKGVWIGGSVVMLLMLAFYIFSEISTPGYMQNVWNKQLFGRFLATSEDIKSYHSGEFLYYIKGFYRGRFWPYFLIFIFGNIWIVFDKIIPNRKLLAFLSIHIFTFLLIISLSGAKYWWYDVPLYPLMSLFIGITFWQLFKILPTLNYKLLLCFVGLSIFSWSYSKTLNFVIKPDERALNGLPSLCYYLKDEKREIPNNLKVLHNGGYNSMYFYIEKARINNKVISIVDSVIQLKVNDIILVNDKYLKENIDGKIKTQLIDQGKGCSLRKVETASY